MNKTMLLLALFFSFTNVYAQKGKVSSAQNLMSSGKIEKALESINEAIDPLNPKSEKSINWPKSWEVRGEIYQAIFQSQDENIRNLSDDPLTEALYSYKKTLKLDDKNKFIKSVKVRLTLLANDLTIQAADFYDAKDFDKSLASFEQILEINSMSIINEDNSFVDTTVVFNAGIAAYNAEKYDIASKYYEQTAGLGYNGAKSYSLWASSLMMKKDTFGAVNVLKTGYKKYPSDSDLLNSLLQTYLDLNKIEEAMNYIEVAIKQDPSNEVYFLVQGSIFEQFNDYEKAIKSYLNAIKLNENYFEAQYNIGVIYFNKGVAQWEIASNVPANENKKYKQELEKADEWFFRSLPYMEKCREIEPEDIHALESLKNIYYRLIPSDKEKYEPKYNEVAAQLNN